MTKDAPLAPQRNQNRQRVLKSAVITFSGGHSTMNCAVRDISETGAKLRFDTPKGPPDTFALRLELDGIEADCEVTWRRVLDVGVKFMAPPRAVAQTRKQTLSSSTALAAKPSLRLRPRGEK